MKCNKKSASLVVIKPPGCVAEEALRHRVSNH